MKQYTINSPMTRASGIKIFMDTLSLKLQEFKRASYPFFLWFAVCACIIISAIWGTRKVWHSLTDLNVFKISPSTFSFLTPSWVNEHFSEDIKRVATLNEQYGMYEDNLTQKIADVYGGIVVVKNVDSIRRVFPNRLNIKLVIRKPVAIVKNGSNTYLVDDDGVLLPKEYYRLQDTEYDSPCIQSNKLARLPLCGSKWNDKGVEAGIELVKFLRANNIHNLFKIVAVDVSSICKRRLSGKSDIILWTENNTQIRWGCSSLCNESNELSDEEKLQNLLSVAKAEGTNLKQMEYVDVRWKKPLGKRWAKGGEVIEER